MTSNSKAYLKQNVQLEPLVNQWYAWSHLVAPASAAMNIANLHLRIMKSYISSPQIHANAVKNPDMLGGPFIDYDGKRVDEIKSLLAKTTREQDHMIKFAESVKKLDEMLGKEAKGFSLEPMYERIPANLKGYVELVYNLNNQPGIRFIEGLLYQSEYYDSSSQSLNLSLIDQDYRAFALSTPRLPDDRSVNLKVPFSDELIDELFKMRNEPQPLEYLQERFDSVEIKDPAFSSLFTDTEAPPLQKYNGEGTRVRYFGHACILIETRDVSILTDPAISYRYDNGIERYTFQDLPQTIDYVLITHGHQDHIIFEALLQLRHRIGKIIVPRSRGGTLEDPSLKLLLTRIGFKDVIELDEMESIDIPGGSITELPFLGEHADLNISSKIAHLVRLKDKTFLFAADSNNIEPRLYEHIFRALGNVDVLFIGMECDGAPLSWLYGPLLTRPLDRNMDQSRRFGGSNYERGIGIVNQFNCSEVYVYAMGQEPWLNYIMSIKYTEQSNPIVASNRLIKDCVRRGIVAERLFGMKELVYR
jgi:L-ascorbate metabolism protein UlaG (beta-lactamase superfamily)